MYCHSPNSTSTQPQLSLVWHKNYIHIARCTALLCLLCEILSNSALTWIKSNIKYIAFMGFRNGTFFIHKGLLIHYMMWFWAFLDPLPPSSSKIIFWSTPLPPSWWYNKWRWPNSTAAGRLNTYFIRQSCYLGLCSHPPMLCQRSNTYLTSFIWSFSE